MAALTSRVDRAHESLTNTAESVRFLSLLDEHKRILYKIAASYSRNPADREDLAQEIVAQLWRSFDSYDESYRFSTWMYRVALNVAISFNRRETRRLRSVVAAEDVVMEFESVPTESSAREDDIQLLWQLIRQLDELDRALIVLYLDGNPHATIAEVLGISETNVGTKINRIKQRLRRDIVPTA
jgi:RNA polymerase sigma-70 factor (ECF subfamily)